MRQCKRLATAGTAPHSTAPAGSSSGCVQGFQHSNSLLVSMHSWINRSNGLLTYAGTVLAVLCLAVTVLGEAIVVLGYCACGRRCRMLRSVPSPTLCLQTSFTAAIPLWSAPLSVQRACRKSLDTIGCATVPLPLAVHLLACAFRPSADPAPAGPPPPHTHIPRYPAVQAYIVLNLTADLRREFTWNTKQLFVFVNAEFETRKNRRNQAAET